MRWTDLDYAVDGTPSHTLDVYYPKGTGEKLPVILNIHGGGWSYGTKGQYQYYCMFLAQQGFAVVSCNYRLAPENPYPAALEDAYTAYTYLLSKGYSPQHITLCGESAGGGLCYALCLKLKEQNMALPASVIAISPWVDLTAGGESYETNRQRDPSLTFELLQSFTKNYGGDPTNPLVSPIFGDLQGFPPSLIFAGEEELLLSDSQNMHKRLLKAGCKSHLVVTPQRWHGYLLYGLEEDKKDFGTINRFLNQTLSQERKLRWMPLDNAAKIYPAARNQNWSNVFRLSATLKETVDADIGIAVDDRQRGA